MTIGFGVESTAGVDQIGLDFDGPATGMAMAGVNQTVFDSKGHWLGFLSVGCYGRGLGGVCNTADRLSLKGPYSDLYIVKDGGVTRFGGHAGFSYVDQLFHATATPEPASFALIEAGLLDVAGLLHLCAPIGQSATLKETPTNVQT